MVLSRGERSREANYYNKLLSAPIPSACVLPVFQMGPRTGACPQNTRSCVFVWIGTRSGHQRLKMWQAELVRRAQRSTRFSPLAAENKPERCRYLRMWFSCLIWGWDQSAERAQNKTRALFFIPWHQEDCEAGVTPPCALWLMLLNLFFVPVATGCPF